MQTETWASLAATASSLGLAIYAGPYDRKSLKELRELRDDLLDEAEAIENVAEASQNGKLTAEQKARWDAVMAKDKGELAQVDAAIAKAEKITEERKRLAVTRRVASASGNPFGDCRIDTGEPRQAAMPAGSGIRFRDAATGKEIRALAYDEPFVALSDDTPGVGEMIRATALGRDLPDGRPIKSQLGGIDSDGGYMLDESLSGRVIDLARSEPTALKAGVWTLPMAARDVSLLRVTGDPAGYWRGETVNVPASDGQFGLIRLSAKTLAAVVPISTEFLEDAPNAAQMIEQQLAAVFGLEIDRAILWGLGSAAEPQGISNTPGVAEISSVGTPADWSDPSAAVQSILEANYAGDPGGLSWIAAPRDWATYDGLTSSADGQPLQPTPWAGQLKRFSTTSVPIAAGNSEMLIGDFSQAVLGLRTGGISFQILSSGTFTHPNGKTYEAATSLQKLIVAHIRADVAVLRPTHFCKLTGVTAA